MTVVFFVSKALVIEARWYSGSNDERGEGKHSTLR